MIYEGLKITLIGISGVFLFLFLMICGMNMLRIALEKGAFSKRNKIALAIALAKHQNDRGI